MEQWTDQGLVLSLRPHGEGGGVVSLLTAQHGRHAGYVHGAHSAKMRGVLQPGNLVDIDWRARSSDNLGTCRIEQQRYLAGGVLGDGLRLGALLSACALCDAALPEREGHPGLFHGLLALFEALDGPVWSAAYIYWELALLRELGFGIDLSRCAGGGPADDLAYVSPKSGCAVGAAAGAPYADKLLPLPSFLSPQGGGADDPAEIFKGLTMTGYFLENWVFAQHSKGVPEERLRFGQRFAKYEGINHPIATSEAQSTDI